MFDFVFKNGVRNGKFTYHNYYNFSNIKKNKKWIGLLKEGRKSGTWQMFDDGVFKKTILYVDDQLKSEYTYEKNILINALHVGIDSIKKFVPNFSSEFRFPLARYGDYMSSSIVEGYLFMNLFKVPLDTILFINYKGKQPICSYVLGDSVNRNFYVDIIGVRDTLINGNKLFYNSYGLKQDLKKGEIFQQNYYIIDSLESKETNRLLNRHLVYLYSISNSIEDSSIYTNSKSDKHYNILKRIFNSTIHNRRYVENNCLIENYTDLDLRFNYTNYSFFKGKLKGLRVLHEIVGDQYKTLIRKMVIPYKKDTLLLTDTLFRNGIPLYQINKLFYSNYTSLTLHEFNNVNWRNDFKVLDDYMYLMFDVKPILHRSINYNGRPFSGHFVVKFKYKQKPNGVDFNYIPSIPYFNQNESINLNIELNEMIHFYTKKVFQMPYAEIRFRCLNGLYSFQLFAKDVFGHNSLVCDYTNNMLVGEFLYNFYHFQEREESQNSIYWNYNLNEMNESGFAFQKAKSIFFSKGKPKGQNANYLNGVLADLNLYENGEINGTQYHYHYDATALSNIYEMRNDTIHGNFYNLSRFGNIISRGQMKNGKGYGEFRLYHDNGYLNIDTNLLFRNYYLKNDILVGNFSEFSLNGIIVQRIKFDEKDSNEIIDTKKIHFKNPVFNTIYNTIDTLEDYWVKTNYLTHGAPLDYLNLTAYFWYYYNDGSLFCNGNKKHNVESGLWQYYKADGKTLFKEVIFKDSVVELGDSSKLNTKGFVRCYYDNGNLMYEGFSINKEVQIVCKGSVGMPIDQILYTNFYDTSGQTLLSNGKGFIVELQLNGYKLREGNLVNYKKEGVWIEYDIKGLPVEMGMYKNGKKDGRWLTGDLSGLNVGRNTCFADAEEFTQYLKEYGGNLELGEEYYSDGVLVNKNEVNTVKR